MGLPHWLANHHLAHRPSLPVMVSAQPASSVPVDSWHVEWVCPHHLVKLDNSATLVSLQFAMQCERGCGWVGPGVSS